MPPFVAPPTIPPGIRAFAEDVAYYLRLAPRQLPSRYLYDALGSALFDAICELPWYTITRAERRLLAAHATDIAALSGPPSAIVELGPGSGAKLAAFLERSGIDRRLTVHLVDVSRAALVAATHALGGFPNVAVVTHEASYEDGLENLSRTPRSDGHLLALFLGSNIGNFDPPGADEFLRRIRGALSTGDALLLGADLVKPARELVLAYDDPLGVTAAFNRNLLVRINRELRGDFVLDAFSHRGVWNETASRVEMHLVSARRQRVRVPGAGLRIELEPGEIIWTESAYKYTAGDVVDMLNRAGFGLLRQWLDERDAFALTLVEAV